MSSCLMFGNCNRGWSDAYGTPQNVALSDQVKSLDWKARNAKHKGSVSQAELETIKQKIGLLLAIS